MLYQPVTSASQMRKKVGFDDLRVGNIARQKSAPYRQQNLHFFSVCVLFRDSTIDSLETMAAQSW